MYKRIRDKTPKKILESNLNIFENFTLGPWVDSVFFIGQSLFFI
jgi:hypothetical protein